MLPILLLLIAALIAIGITNAANNATEPETEQTFTEEGDGYYIWVRAVDHAGNKGPWSEAQRVWIDASGPSAPVIEGGSSAYALSRTISVVTESDDNGASGVAYYEYYKKSGADKPDENAEGTKVTTSATSQTFNTNIAGEYVFFRAVDVVGNKGAWSDGQQVYIDVNVPTVTCKQANSTLTIKQGDNLELLDYFTITPTGTNTAYTAQCTVGSNKCDTTESFTAANSPYTVTCTATITGGNSNSATMTVVVEAAGPANIDQATSIQSATTQYQDDKGNTVWVPGGYKIIVDTTVDKGVVIADSSGNEFVWIPVGTITKADGTQVTIDLGRYTFDTSTGSPTLVQAGSAYASTVTIGDYYQELATSRTSDGSTTNTTAKNLAQFYEKTNSRKGFYLGRYESSNSTTGNSVKGASPAANITQPNAATAARA